jgi:predicted dehydrogenase
MIDRLFAACTDGFIELNPATQYHGMSGRSSKGSFSFPSVFQQKLQIEDFVRCVTQDKDSIVKGEEGLNDMLVIDAIHESIRTRKKIAVNPV